MEINIFYSFVVAAILQGLWLGFMLLNTTKKSTKASKFLGYLVLVVTITQLLYFLEEIEIITWHQFNILYFPFEFLEAPFLYFFVAYYLYPAKKFHPFEKALFLPFLFYLLNTLTYKLISLYTGKNWSNHPVLNVLADLCDYYGDLLNIPLFLIVLVISLYRISNFKRNIGDNESKNVRAELFWLTLLFTFILATLIPWFYYAYQYLLDDSASYLPLDIVVSLSIYLLGYIGMHKLNVLNQRERLRAYTNATISISTEESSKNGYISTIERIAVFEKRFLDPAFSSESLAKELQISKSHLSRIFNKEMNVSFTDYINSLRVAEAKRYLQNPEFSNYTLVAIGLEAGFNSKTTFNTTFKKITGQTPSQFKKSASN